jgi:hypothetical protein
MESEPTLISALVKAQSEMSHAAFDQTNPHFKSKFASLKSVIDAVKPALNANGIAYVQRSVPMDQGIAVETVFHGHGEELRTGPVPVPIDRENAQGFGSALTYAKRYSLAMACGISADEDDDGNAAAKAPPKKRGQSVIETVMQESGIQVDQAKRDQYATALVNCVQQADEAGINELIEELNTDSDMKIAVWRELPSGVRTSITKMRGEKQ